MSERQQPASRSQIRPPHLSSVSDGQTPRPSVFIGSSSKGVEVARAIQFQLEDTAECDVWNEGVFGLNMGNLESLVQALDTFDFAVLVLTPDDMLIANGEQKNAPRDNVLLELGLFMGRLGRSRTFAVCPKHDEMKLPSDLAGVTLAMFSPPDDPARLIAALGPACFKIRTAMRSQYKRAALQELQENLSSQQTQIKKQQEQISYQQNVINQLVVFSMAFYIFRHLEGIYDGKRKRGEYLFRKNGNFERELRYLRDAGYIEWISISGLVEGQNLVNALELTPAGNFFVEVRREYERRSGQKSWTGA